MIKKTMKNGNKIGTKELKKNGAIKEKKTLHRKGKDDKETQGIKNSNKGDNKKRKYKERAKEFRKRSNKGETKH